MQPNKYKLQNKQNSSSNLIYVERAHFLNGGLLTHKVLHTLLKTYF